MQNLIIVGIWTFQEGELATCHSFGDEGNLVNLKCLPLQDQGRGHSSGE